MTKSSMKVYESGSGYGGWTCCHCRTNIMGKNEREIQTKIKLHLKVKHSVNGIIGKNFANLNMSYLENCNSHLVLNKIFENNKQKKQKDKNQIKEMIKKLEQQKK